MFKLTAESNFAAAHRIREYGGDCENMHGHNFRVLMTAAYRDLPDTGMCADFRDLGKALGSVLGTLDHKDINSLEYFSGVNPTSENIAKYIFDRVKEKGIPVSQITVFETERYSATYSEE